MLRETPILFQKENNEDGQAENKYGTDEREV